VLVARREERLRALADELGGATVVAVDLLEPEAPARVAATVEEAHGRLDLLVNNAGAAWHAPFAEAGSEGVRRHMELNFDAVVRLTEALLPLLRRSAPSAIVNVSSIAGRAATRWVVSTPEKVAEAIVDAGPGGRAERYVPRPYWLVGAVRAVAPGLLRRVTTQRSTANRSSSSSRNG
jgi:NADP-dependent 3-hydroxy acid dehydrogenase YdfG